MELNSNNIHELFDKYINNECTTEEITLLHKFLDSYQGGSHDVTSLGYDSKDAFKRKLWDKISKKTHTKAQKKRRITPLLRYAAILICIISAAQLLKWYTTQTNSKELFIEDQSITITNSKNEKQSLESNDNQTITNKQGHVIAIQTGNQLSYKDNASINDIVYNEIYVPKGKTFTLVLSDGTVVHLNADTKLTFPSNFHPGKDREVFLNGEAYFEVVENKEAPFKVQTNDLKITVLGTQFLVNTYNQDPFAVLTEGSVALQIADQPSPNTIIIPGQKATLKSQKFEIKQVNTANYLSWIHGELVFENEPFLEIIKKIERRYNVQIINTYEAYNNVEFRGKFDNESIIDMLETFKESALFDYSIQNNQIIISKPKNN